MRKNKETPISEKILYYGLYSVPILLILSTFCSLPIFALIKGSVLFLFLLHAIYHLLQKKENWKIIFVYLLFCIVEILYLQCKNFSLLSNGIFLLEISVLPIAILYFKQIGNSYIHSQFYMNYMAYMILFFTFFRICFPINFLKIQEESILLIAIFLPITLKTLLHHSNYLTKVLGYFFIVLFILLCSSKGLSVLLFLILIILLFSKEEKQKQKEVLCLFLISLLLCGFTWSKEIVKINSWQSLDSEVFHEHFTNLKETSQNFFENNLEEQFFGEEIEIKTSDYLQIIKRIGIVGLLFYLALLLFAFYQMKGTKEQRITLFLALLLTIYGGLFTNGMIGILLGTFCVTLPKEKKRILLVSNMYPSNRFKHYGSFVKNTQEILETVGFQVDLVVKKKNITFPAKLINYIKMYIKAIILSNLNSYDYIYVHYIAQSAFCVLLAKWMSPKTILIYHVHGPDVLPSQEKERKNIARSKFVLPYADKVIVPSEYFKKGLQTKYHVAEEKLIVSPSGGVNRDLFQKMNQKECQKELQLNPDNLYFGFVSRIEDKKGWDLYLRAIKNLENHPVYSKIKLLVIGTGSKQKEFDHLVAELNLQEKLIHRSFAYQTDLVKYYNAMDVLIYSTQLKESLGLTPLEAMASETLVIGRRKYGPKEYFIDHQNCLAFETEEELNQKINEFLKMKDFTKQKICKKARQDTERYDSKKVMEQMKKIFC